MRRAFLIAVIAAASCRGIVDSPLGLAHAAAVPGRFSVVATVSNTCDVGGGTSLALGAGLLDFGKHRIVDTVTSLLGRELSRPVKATMPVVCSNSRSAPQVSFDRGLHAFGSQRHLLGPHGTRIAYDLLRGAASNAAPWDENAYPISLMGGELADIPVYGVIRSIPPGAEDGFYTDTVIVQLDF